MARMKIVHKLDSDGGNPCGTWFPKKDSVYWAYVNCINCRRVQRANNKRLLK